MIECGNWMSNAPQIEIYEVYFDSVYQVTCMVRTNLCIFTLSISIIFVHDSSPRLSYLPADWYILVEIVHTGFETTENIY